MLFLSRLVADVYSGALGVHVVCCRVLPDAIPMIFSLWYVRAVSSCHLSVFSASCYCHIIHHRPVFYWCAHSPIPPSLWYSSCLEMWWKCLRNLVRLFITIFYSPLLDLAKQMCKLGHVILWVTHNIVCWI